MHRRLLYTTSLSILFLFYSFCGYNCVICAWCLFMVFSSPCRFMPSYGISDFTNDVLIPFHSFVLICPSRHLCYCRFKRFLLFHTQWIRFLRTFLFLLHSS